MLVTCKARNCEVRFESYHNVKQYCSATHRRREIARRTWHKAPRKRLQRNARIKRLWGLTEAQYNEMLTNQDGRCAICKRLPTTCRLAVDHDHTTNKIRGLLCMPCNRHLGWREAYGLATQRYLGVDAKIDIDDYQTWAATTDIGPGTDWHYTLGLVGETGEVAEKIKKAYRTPPIPIDPQTMGSELSDVVWYLARLASLYGYRLSDIAEMNKQKLMDRQQRGKLQGEGDNR